MWELAKNLFITKGFGEADYKLNSFDFALLDANIANFNHSIQSSIIPPGCKINFKFNDAILPGEGSILPTIYSRKHGVTGDTICAGLGFGINADPTLPGLVYELTGNSSNQVTHELRCMLEAAAQIRGWTLASTHLETQKGYVSKQHGCVLVAAVLLP